ncbi:hypothetical protein SLS60_002366 [Paraconiothyrium brasiliense]|uniref:Uncharacterized protein n=1 Tax=Paraconiothyrium brasiliense TaxID=300254 RepID=A0ABR3S1Y7_9PLEO
MIQSIDKKLNIKIAHGDLSGKKVDILPILRLNARFFADRIFETIHIDLPKAFNYYGMSADGRLDRLLKRGDEPWLSIMRGDNSHWRTLSSVLMNHDQRILEMVFESDASSNKPVPGDEDIGKRAPGNRGWDIFIWRAAL